MHLFQTVLTRTIAARDQAIEPNFTDAATSGTFFLKMQSLAICCREDYRLRNVHVLLTQTIAHTIKADASNHYFHVYIKSHMGVLAAALIGPLHG